MRVKESGPEKPIAEHIAAEVRAEMARQRLSQQSLAVHLGWPQPRLSRRLTSGKTSVPFTVDELSAVADALGVPVTTLIPAQRTNENAA